MPPAVYALRPPQNSAATNLTRAQFILNLINTEIEISICVVKYRHDLYRGAVICNSFAKLCFDIVVSRNCAVVILRNSW